MRTVVLRTVLAVVAGCALLSACAPTPPPALVARTVEATPAADPVAPCSVKTPAAAAPSDPSTTPTATFDRVANVISLSAGQHVTLAALSRVLHNPAALQQLAPGEWLLGASLQILKGASLDVAAPDVHWLKLSSTKRGSVALKAVGGDLAVTGTCVTSWDPDLKKVDTDYTDGRSFLLARDGGQMAVDQSELRFLGFGQGESYGLSWRLPGTGGRITHSVVSDLYFGVYSYQVAGLVIADNQFYNNVVYGVDPHTGSHDLQIERNTVHDNGKHGIILAENCTASVIRDNVVYNNHAHGIVLYLNSNTNTVENNESFGNLAQGININEASANTVRGNRIYHNAETGVGIGQGAKGNILDQNDIRSNQQDGVRLFSEAAQNTVSKNVIGDNGRYGVYVDSDSPFVLTGNTIFGSRVGVLLKGAATASQGDNQLYGNAQADIRSE